MPISEFERGQGKKEKDFNQVNFILLDPSQTRFVSCAIAAGSSYGRKRHISILPISLGCQAFPKKNRHVCLRFFHSNKKLTKHSV
jgi:hypothetical protein